MDRIVFQSKEFSEKSLTNLIKSLILARDPLTNSLSVEESTWRDSDLVLCVEIMTSIALINENRLNSVWPIIQAFFQRIFENRSSHKLGQTYVLERMTVSILRVAMRLLHRVSAFFCKQIQFKSFLLFCLFCLFLSFLLLLFDPPPQKKKKILS